MLNLTFPNLFRIILTPLKNVPNQDRPFAGSRKVVAYPESWYPWTRSRRRIPSRSHGCHRPGKVKYEKFCFRRRCGTAAILAGHFALRGFPPAFPGFSPVSCSNPLTHVTCYVTGRSSKSRVSGECRSSLFRPCQVGSHFPAYFDLRRVYVLAEIHGKNCRNAPVPAANCLRLWNASAVCEWAASTYLGVDGDLYYFN